MSLMMRERSVGFQGPATEPKRHEDVRVKILLDTCRESPCNHLRLQMRVEVSESKVVNR